MGNEIVDNNIIKEIFLSNYEFFKGIECDEEFLVLSDGKETFKCEKCGWIGKVRSVTKRKICRGCGATWKRVN